jgi:delta 1-pyrroline-5-carboxylate dehydrogenase
MSETVECPSDDGNVMLHVATIAVGLVLVLVGFIAKEWDLIHRVSLWIEYLTVSVPTIDVELSKEITEDDGVEGDPCKETILVDPKEPNVLNCYDPSTNQCLGQAKNMNAQEVHELLVKAKKAQEEWSKTTFQQRRLVLRTIQKYICQHVQEICRVSARDSGKPMVDAVMGEIITTCEKIRTICAQGELWLKPSFRPTGPMMIHKSAWVEYVPLGVIVAIAPWNYPVRMCRLQVKVALLYPHTGMQVLPYKKMISILFHSHFFSAF